MRKHKQRYVEYNKGSLRKLRRLPDGIKDSLNVMKRYHSIEFMHLERRENQREKFRLVDSRVTTIANAERRTKFELLMRIFLCLDDQFMLHRPVLIDTNVFVIAWITCNESDVNRHDAVDEVLQGSQI
jgi:hypothetical protein